jgi:hypothetical protein
MHYPSLHECGTYLKAVALAFTIIKPKWAWAKKEIKDMWAWYKKEFKK